MLGEKLIIENAVERLIHLSEPRRALAVNALARAYLHAPLSAKDQVWAERGLVAILEDPSTIVRRTLADALADATNVNERLILALANDEFFVAEPVLRRSPVPTSDQLIDIVTAGNSDAQSAIASRVPINVELAAAMASMGCLKACMILVRNPGCEIYEDSIRTIAQRFSDDCDMCDELLGWPNLPEDVRRRLSTISVKAKSRRTPFGDRNVAKSLNLESTQFAA